MPHPLLLHASAGDILVDIWAGVSGGGNERCRRNGHCFGIAGRRAGGHEAC